MLYAGPTRISLVGSQVVRAAREDLRRIDRISAAVPDEHRATSTQSLDDGQIQAHSRAYPS
jgi:hypothetical protein